MCEYNIILYKITFNTNTLMCYSSELKHKGVVLI